MTKLLLTLAILTTFLGNSSCSRINFNPDVYLPNIDNNVIVNEDGNTVGMNSRQMLEFSCMHESKWRELAEILEREGAHKSNIRSAKQIYQSVQKNQE